MNNTVDFSINFDPKIFQSPQIFKIKPISNASNMNYAFNNTKKLNIKFQNQESIKFLPIKQKSVDQILNIDKESNCLRKGYIILYIWAYIFIMQY